METKTYILKLTTDNKKADNEATLEYILNVETGKNIVAYSFKEIEIPLLPEESGE